MNPVIDVHTHMLNNEWLRLLEKHGRPRYTLKPVAGGLRVPGSDTLIACASITVSLEYPEGAR